MQKAVICLKTEEGYQEHPCRVVGETQKRYQIDVDQPTRLPPAGVLRPGVTRLVPKYAVKFKWC